MSDTFIFSATAGKKEDSMLYNTCKDEGIEVFMKEFNKESLQKTYNKAIDFAIKERVENLVLVHDDVILEAFSENRIEKNFKQYDLVGIAGCNKVTLEKPVLWHIMGGGFDSGNLVGQVACGVEGQKHMGGFGFYPNRCILVDGVFLLIKREVFKKIRFDETCPSKWHFYDLDYSMQCHKAGFKVGVGDFIITHKSPGLTSMTEEFHKGEDWFLDKWKTQ
tara:strand:+ start:1116 stop:1775 length:660 start_codon:yes stop_codon:yes gene_type:complete